MKKLILSVVILFTLASCSNVDGTEVNTSNSEVEVELLFEHDGIKVYRFYDQGRPVYYTDARGKTTSSYTSGGKAKTTHYIQNETIE